MKICRAMADAGIIDPESQKGKDFCTELCPYDVCIIYEPKRPTVTTKSKSRALEAKELMDSGLDVKEIAQRLRVSIRTVQRYLEKFEEEDEE